MGRILSSICLAFCGIIGVVIVFNLCVSLPRLILHPTARGPELWGVIAGYVISAIVAIALLVAAVALRRHLKTLDAKLENPDVIETSK